MYIKVKARNNGDICETQCMSVLCVISKILSVIFQKVKEVMWYQTHPLGVPGSLSCVL